jgi:hypothetical protein
VELHVCLLTSRTLLQFAPEGCKVHTQQSTISRDFSLLKCRQPEPPVVAGPYRVGIRHIPVVTAKSPLLDGAMTQVQKSLVKPLPVAVLQLLDRPSLSSCSVFFRVYSTYQWMPP